MKLDLKDPRDTEWNTPISYDHIQKKTWTAWLFCGFVVKFQRTWYTLVLFLYPEFPPFIWYFVAFVFGNSSQRFQITSAFSSRPAVPTVQVLSSDLWHLAFPPGTHLTSCRLWTSAAELEKTQYSIYSKAGPVFVDCTELKSKIIFNYTPPLPSSSFRSAHPVAWQSKFAEKHWAGQNTFTPTDRRRSGPRTVSEEEHGRKKTAKSTEDPRSHVTTAAFLPMMNPDCHDIPKII